MEAEDFELWPDGFNIENIPSNIMNKAFHVSIDSITGNGNNQWDQETALAVTINFFIKGYADPSLARDDAIIEAENIVKASVRPSERTLSQCIQNVIFESADFGQIADSNDNAVLATINFNVRVILETLT